MDYFNNYEIPSKEPDSNSNPFEEKYPEIHEVVAQKKQHNAWKYILTSVFSVVLSCTIMYFLLPETRSSIKLPFVASDNGVTNQIEQVTKTEGEVLSVADIAKKNGPAIVGVNIKTTSTYWGQTYESEGSGSGIVLTSDGYIVTNNHVVEGAKEVSVKFYNGDEYIAKIVGTDSKTDLAVIKVDAENLEYAELGVSGELAVGELAVAIGNPLGDEFAGSVTVGFISALNRTIEVDGRIYKLIQTDAAINAGNSGGALINQQGQVVGINSVKISTAEGMGFAIPIDIAKPIIDDLIAHGYVTGRPIVGFSGQNITKAMSEYYDIPIGIYVSQVELLSGAEDAGLQKRDVIVKAGGKECLTMEKFEEIKLDYKAGDTISIEIKRKNNNDEWETLTLDVVLGEEKPSNSN